jgi:hypothetical protein
MSFGIGHLRINAIISAPRVVNMSVRAPARLIISFLLVYFGNEAALQSTLAAKNG